MAIILCKSAVASFLLIRSRLSKMMVSISVPRPR
jgi:hypothetical protein